MDWSTADDEELKRSFGRLGFVTCSPNVISVLRRACKAAAASDITVLLQGETGSGKQVLAEWIHAVDQKSSAHPFITVNCSTISESLAKSELFRHQRRSFSAASSQRKGLF